MKLAICVILMLISAKECDKKNTELSNEITSTQAEMRMQEQTKISYRSSTRGFFLKLWIEGDSISITKDYNLKEIDTYLIPKVEQEALLKLLSETDEKSLSELEILSKTHRYDAAPAAFLEISKGDEIYRTNTFDHGKPPKPIRDLIEKILSIKTMVEKQ